MMLSLGHLLVLLLTPLWTALLHALAIRGWKKGRLSPQKLALLCCGIITLGVSLTTGVESATFLQRLFVPLITGLLAHLYFQIFNLSETARRIRILIHLKLGRPTEPENDITRKMISVRLERLVGLGQLRKIQDRYFAKQSWLLFVARMMRWHEKLLFPRRAD